MRKRITAALSVVALMIALIVIAIVTAMSSQPSAARPPTNTDPRKGPVHVTAHIDKICDGTTLIYYNTDGGDAGGVAAIADSPECPI